MGQKTNPIGLRLRVVKTLDSRWFAKKGYAEMLKEDLLIKRYLKKRLYQAGISKITIERKGEKITIGIRTPRPGLVIGSKVEQRVSFRCAKKKGVPSSLRAGAQGLRINCTRRLGGSEMARFETYREGRVPLHTLRADLDFARATATTAYGTCGVKVWMFHGEVLDKAAIAAGHPTQSGPAPVAR